MTRLEPVAVLAIDGVDVASSTPAGVPTGLLALDGVEVTWGREEALDQQEAAVGRLELFDPTRTWHRSRNWIGVPVTLRWELTAAGVTTSRVFFRGRITRVRPSLRELAGVKGAVVALELASKFTDLGNIFPPTWPYQDLSARRARVHAAAIDAGIAGGVTTRSDWDATGLGSVTQMTFYLDTDGVPLSTRILDVFDVLVDRLNYSPDADAITAVGSRDYGSRVTLGRLAADPVGSGTNRAGQGVYARARALLGGAGLYLDAADLEVSEETAATRDQASAISRIVFTTYSSVAPPTEDYVTTRTVTGVDESLTGTRSINVQAKSASAFTKNQLDRWEGLVGGDAAAWKLEPVTLSTAETGGFEALDQVLELLSGSESNVLIFLQGSELPLLGLCPVVSIMGATLSVLDGHWVLEFTPAPVSLHSQTAGVNTLQHPISFDEFDDGTPANQVQFWDTPHPNGLHPSLTFEDLAWVGLGNGVADATAVTDKGWDYLP